MTPNGVTADEYLAALSLSGLKKITPNPSPAYIDRMNHEIKQIAESGAAKYFLVVWDFIDFAGDQCIPVKLESSFLMKSLVAYSLQIIDIDPMKGMTNSDECGTYPNVIDLDNVFVFPYGGADIVVQYLSEKYGQDCFALVADCPDRMPDDIFFVLSGKPLHNNRSFHTYWDSGFGFCINYDTVKNSGLVMFAFRNSEPNKRSGLTN